MVNQRIVSIIRPHPRMHPPPQPPKHTHTYILYIYIILHIHIYIRTHPHTHAPLGQLLGVCEVREGGVRVLGDDLAERVRLDVGLVDGEAVLLGMGVARANGLLWLWLGSCA